MIVYKVTNKINGKCYIGITSQPLKTRMAQHKSKSGKIINVFYHAIRKYGWDNFVWEIIETCSSREQLNSREEFHIKASKSHRDDYGYNSTVGGDGTAGFKFSDESKFNMAVKSRSRAVRMYGLKKQLNLFHHNYMKSPSTESRAKLSATTKGKQSGRFKIHPAEWLFVHFRRLAGDSFKSIAETYNVSASAVFHFYGKYEL